MPPRGWEQVRRVLVVRLDNAGDVIMLGPALRALRDALPAARLTLMASPAGSQAAPLLPWIDEVIAVRAVWQDASAAMPLDPARERGLVARIREARVDAAIVFTSFSQSPYPPAYACYLAGVPIRIGQSKEFGGSLLSQYVRPGPDWAHQVDRNLALIEQAGFRAADHQLEVRVTPAMQAEADALLREAGIDPGSRFGVVAPAASCAARTYPWPRFAEVIAALPARLGRPAVVLYSGTEYEQQWRPRSCPARLLRRATDCSPCYRFTCPYHMECLDIPPGDVVAASRQLLERGADRRAAATRPREADTRGGEGLYA